MIYKEVFGVAKIGRPGFVWVLLSGAVLSINDVELNDLNRKYVVRFK